MPQQSAYAGIIDSGEMECHQAVPRAVLFLCAVDARDINFTGVENIPRLFSIARRGRRP